MIYLSAVFSHNVTLYHTTPGAPHVATTPYIILETGAQNRQALYHSSSTKGNVLIFKYTVQPGDSTADLDYASTSALIIPATAYIRRTSTTPTTDIDPTLATPGDTNSLGDKGALSIDTTTPKIDRLTASTSLNPSSYLDGTTALAAGDEVYLEAKYNFPVSVVGEPRLYVYTGATTPVAQETIVAVPENFDYQYDPKLVKTSQTLGINLQFSLMNTLAAAETVEFFLPNFGAAVPDIGNLTMVARHPVTYKQLPISGSWDATNKKIVLTAKKSITSALSPLSPADALFPSGITGENGQRAKYFRDSEVVSVERHLHANPTNATSWSSLRFTLCSSSLSSQFLSTLDPPMVSQPRLLVSGGEQLEKVGSTSLLHPQRAL